MEKLNVTKGGWRVEDPKYIGKWAGFNTYQGKVRSIYSANDDLEAIALIPKDYILHNKDQDYEANAVLIADAGTTYNKCGLTPSQLLQQNRELVEALQYFVNRVDEGTIKSRTTYEYYKELLTKHQDV